MLTARPGLCALLLWLLPAGAAHAACDAADQAELDKLKGYVSEVGESLVLLQQQLADSERRKRTQAQLIEQLEQRLLEQQRAGPQGRRERTRAFFHDLAGNLPLSPVYRIETDRLIVSADAVFVFGTGEIGAEGISRLHPVAVALRRSTAGLDPDQPWRLRIEGHTDSRPIRSNRRFPSNWELSAARAVSLLKILRSGGIEAERLYASGFAAVRPLSDGSSKADHRRNRRIEVHLELNQP